MELFLKKISIIKFDEVYKQLFTYVLQYRGP